MIKNKYTNGKSRTPKAVAWLLALLLTGAASGCSGVNSGGQDTGAVTESSGELTVDLTDDRTLTPTEPYEARLRDAFAAMAPVPAADLAYTLDEDGATVTGYTGGEVAVVIPDTLERRPVTAVAEGAFRGLSTLRAVSLPDSVTSVGFGAFEGCVSLTTLRTPVFTCGEEKNWFGALFGSVSYEINASRVPSTLSTLILTGGERVPDYCFYGCFGLSAISLSEDISALGAFAFYGCANLAYVSLPGRMTDIGSYAFAHCTSLLTLSVPATCESVGISTLEGCTSLESLTLPFVGGSRQQNTYLGYLFGAADHTFTEGYVPATLIRVTLLPGCLEVPANAFFECTHIREVVLPQGVATIGHRAFYRCAYLASITLPWTLTSIGDEAFKQDIRLTEVDLSTAGAGLSLGIQTFMDCDSLRTVTLPDDMSDLPSGTFAGCGALSTVNGGRNVDFSGSSFYGCVSLPGRADADTQGA